MVSAMCSEIIRRGGFHAILVLLLTIGVSGLAMAIEEAEYDVILEDGDIELRYYQPYIVAETIVAGDFEEAGEQAFKRLFDYISGNNQSQVSVAMTAPVSQSSGSSRQGQSIDMTAPVSQQQDASGWAVNFMLPSQYTQATAPLPNDPAVELRQVPRRYMAAIRYSGFWSQKSYQRHKEQLQQWLDMHELSATASPVWARYNSPFMPWFLRRNEVLIPLESDVERFNSLKKSLDPN